MKYTAFRRLHGAVCKTSFVFSYVPGVLTIYCYFKKLKNMGLSWKDEVHVYVDSFYAMAI